MRFAPFGALAVLLCACVACGGGGNSIAPLPSVTATPDGNPTAVPIPVVAPFFVETTSPVSVGTSEDSIAFAGGPYAGVLALDAPSSTVTSGLTVDLIVESDTPVGFPALQSARRSAAETRRTASATGPVSALLSLRFVYSATLGTTTGSLTVTCPAAAIVPGAAYYAAYYDPNALSFGYQFGWAGPAAVSGNRLTFTLPANTTFVGRTTYVMTMYALSVRAPIPTPVPKPTPSPTPSASPSVAPTTSPTPPASPSAPATAAPSTNPSSTPSPPVAPSATPTSTPSPSPTPSPNPTQTPVPGAVIVSLVDVSIPAPGSSVNLTVSETGYVGLFNEQDSCGGTTPIAQINPRSGSGPSFTTTIVGLNPGVCVATFRDSGSGSATISIKVTSSGFTIKSKGRNTK